MFNAFSWAKNTARGVSFVFGFNMYLFLAQCEQVYPFLALALIHICFLLISLPTQNSDHIT